MWYSYPYYLSTCDDTLSCCLSYYLVTELQIFQLIKYRVSKQVMRAFLLVTFAVVVSAFPKPPEDHVSDGTPRKRSADTRELGEMAVDTVAAAVS